MSDHFLDIVLLHQTSARYVELFVARDSVAPPVVSPLAAGVKTATEIDREPSDLMNPVVGAEVGSSDDSLYKILLGTFGSIRVVLVDCTGHVVTWQLSVEHLKHRLGLDVRLVT